MEAIVLAGGFGTRLRSVVSDVPKPMAPVAGRPFLEILLTSLKRRGITRAILSVGYMHSVITSYFETNPIGMELIYEIESEPLGTGGAIRAALKQVAGESAFVFNGDTYMELDLEEVARMWPGDRTPIIVARAVSDAQRYGRLDISESRIVRFSPPGMSGAGLVNAGCYLIPTNVLANVTAPMRFSFEQDFLACCPALSLRAYISGGQFIDIGVPEDYARAQIELASANS